MDYMVVFDGHPVSLLVVGRRGGVPAVDVKWDDGGDSEFRSEDYDVAWAVRDLLVALTVRCGRDEAAARESVYVAGIPGRRGRRRGRTREEVNRHFRAIHLDEVAAKEPEFKLTRRQRELVEGWRRGGRDG